MKKIISILLLFVFLAGFMNVGAQEETQTFNAEDVDVEQVLDETTLSEEEVGLTPDKFGYGLGNRQDFINTNPTVITISRVSRRFWFIKRYPIPGSLLSNYFFFLYKFKNFFQINFFT